MTEPDAAALGRTRGVDLTVWPPRYDADLPARPDAEHWLPEIECADPAARDALIFAKLTHQVALRVGAEPVLPAPVAGGGRVAGDPQEPRRPRALPGGAEGGAARRAGGRAALRRLPLHRARARWRASTGPAAPPGGPPCSASERDDWGRIGEAHARILWGAGIRPDDRILICSFFSLYLGSWGALAGGERLGATVFPFGAGAQGQTLEGRAVGARSPARRPSTARRPTRCTSRRPPAARASTPRASASASSSSPASPARASRPPGALIEQTFGGICVDMGSMAEMSPWMTNGECRHRTGMHLWQDLVYTQVCDPETFRPLPYGAEGTPVYTHLERTSQPMIRLVSGDRARWVDEPCPCGRTYPRLPHGPLRPLRRHDHRARREHLPERHRGHAARHRRLRRRVPRDRLAPRGHGRAAGPRRVHRRPTAPPARARCAR